jgi:hypothetical protein
MDPGDARTDVLDVLWLVVPWLDGPSLRTTRLACSFAKIVVDDHVSHETHDRAEAARMIGAPRIGLLGASTVASGYMDRVSAAPHAWQWVTEISLRWQRSAMVPNAVCGWCISRDWC